jgi:hypothetical protein
MVHLNFLSFALEVIDKSQTGKLIRQGALDSFSSNQEAIQRWPSDAARDQHRD